LGPTKPTFDDINVTNINFSTDDTTAGLGTPMGITVYPSSTIPLFKLPVAGYINNPALNTAFAVDSNTGTLTNPTAINTTLNIVGRYTIKCDDGTNYKGVKLIPGTNSWTVTSDATIGEVSPDPTVAVDVSNKQIFPRTIGTVDTKMPADGNFYFYIDVSNILTAGKYSKIFIDVPVIAIDAKAGTGTGNAPAGDWRIRGGTVNDNLDKGDTGGAVLLFVDTPTPPTMVGPFPINVGPWE